jgi:hypothetical protein
MLLMKLFCMFNHSATQSEELSLQKCICKSQVRYMCYNQMILVHKLETFESVPIATIWDSSSFNYVPIMKVSQWTECCKTIVHYFNQFSKWCALKFGRYLLVSNNFFEQTLDKNIYMTYNVSYIALSLLHNILL